MLSDFVMDVLIEGVLAMDILITLGLLIAAMALGWCLAPVFNRLPITYLNPFAPPEDILKDIDRKQKDIADRVEKLMAAVEAEVDDNDE